MAAISHKIKLLSSLAHKNVDNNKDSLQFNVYGLKSDENVHEDSQVIQKSAYFVKGFDDLKQIADSLGIPFYIYLHAEQGELKRQRYNEMGHHQILLWADSAKVTLMNGMEEGERPEMYRDVIHFNEKGQRHLADVLKTIIE